MSRFSDRMHQKVACSAVITHCSRFVALRKQVLGYRNKPQGSLRKSGKRVGTNRN